MESWSIFLRIFSYLKKCLLPIEAYLSKRNWSVVVRVCGKTFIQCVCTNCTTSDQNHGRKKYGTKNQVTDSILEKKLRNVNVILSFKMKDLAEGLSKAL